MDDFLLFDQNKAVLLRWRQAVEERLRGLRLKIHPGAHPRPVGECFPFLGFVVFPNRRRLKRRKGIHFRRKLKNQNRQYLEGRISLDKVNASVLGWVNHVRFGNTVGLRKAVFEDCIIRRRGGGAEEPA